LEEKAVAARPELHRTGKEILVSPLVYNRAAQFYRVKLGFSDRYLT
jgi:hypothetical protein